MTVFMCSILFCVMLAHAFQFMIMDYISDSTLLIAFTLIYDYMLKPTNKHNS